MSKVKRVLILSLTVLLWACQDKQQDKENTVVEQYPTLTIKKENTTVFSDYPTILQGIKDVELRPKVNGFIQEILIDEGQFVTKGQLLFRIYAPEHIEENASAMAQVKQVEAEVNDAVMKVEKARPLVEQNIISKYELESAQYNLKSKQAQLSKARANVNSTKANVSYTQITAPFDGVIGLIPYKEGALVSSSSVEPLTIISDITFVNAYFSMNEKQFFDFMGGVQDLSVKQKLALLPNVTLILSNLQPYNQKGVINTVSGQIDPLTGSINFRAVFDNKQGLLRSGNSATVRVYEIVENAMLIPQKATYDIQGKRFVYVLDQTGTVKSREVVLLDKEPSSESYIVVSGLSVGEVIVSGDIGGVKDGSKIKSK